MKDKIRRFLIQTGETSTVGPLMEYIYTLKPDIRYEVSVKPYRKNRSNEQNSYLWGVVYETISQETGYTPAEVHQIFAEMFLSYEKQDRKFVQSTTRLNTMEMEDYLSKVRMFASTDLGIYVSLPNETKWSEVK